MKPVKYKEYVTEVSERLNMPESQVDLVLRAFWQEVRSVLSSMKFPRVQIPHLGTFIAKPTVIEKRLTERRGILAAMRSNGTRAERIKADAATEIDQLENALRILSEEKARKASIRKSRLETI
jgi:hypothetical protein